MTAAPTAPRVDPMVDVSNEVRGLIAQLDNLVKERALMVRLSALSAGVSEQMLAALRHTLGELDLATQAVEHHRRRRSTAPEIEAALQLADRIKALEARSAAAVPEVQVRRIDALQARIEVLVSRLDTVDARLDALDDPLRRDRFPSPQSDPEPMTGGNKP